MQLKAHAKINWALAITGKRPDEYHLLDTLMQTISLHDTLDFFPGDSLLLTIEGDENLAVDDNNLILRAAKSLKKATGCTRGAHIRLTKRIPMGAGLGGGSADAAATLKGLNALWSLNLSEQTITDLGLEIGADIPFCLRSGLARVRGIGEHVLSFPAIPPVHLVIVQPCGGLSTIEVYRRYDQMENQRLPPIDAIADRFIHGDVRRAASLLGNSMEPAALSMQPEIGICISALRDAGALGCAMSGSGSAVFAVCKDEGDAMRIAATARSRWEKTWTAKTF